jgi:signal transduction histidine kinase
LRFGYGAVIAVLVLTTVEAYRIQLNVSEQHMYIYRSYLEMDGALSTLRRNLWLAGNDIRDFFINTTPTQAAELRKKVEMYKAENEAALERLARIPASVREVPRLRRSLDDYWKIVDPAATALLTETDERKFEFLQSEIVPRRGELYNALLAVSSADQQKVKESEQEFAHSRRSAGERLLAMLAVSALLSLLAARFSLRHSEALQRVADQHLADVEQARTELKQLSARLLEVEEEGKRTISRELHDEIGQTLALLEIEISNAQKSVVNPQETRDRLQRARELARRSVQAVRNMSVLLRPALLDDLGLVPALQFQLEDFIRRSGIHCDLNEKGVADELPDAVKTCVYRVIQEALHNAEKHSGASRVSVDITQADEVLTVSIRDNGKGFDIRGASPPGRRGLGLLGIRERVAIAGGSVSIESEPGVGTRIQLRIPVPSPSNSKDMFTRNEVIA